MKALPIELKRKWEEAYRKTPNTHKIAKMFNVSQYAVFNHLSREGILNKPKRIPPQILNQAIAIYINEKVGTSEIEKRLDISSFHLWKILNERGISRDKFQAMKIAQRRLSKYMQYPSYKFKDKIDGNVAWIIGAWMGDGHRTEDYCISISGKSKEFMEEFARRFSQAYSTNPRVIVSKDQKHLRFWLVRVKTKDVVQFYLEITEKGQKIPEEILNSVTNMMSFLSGFFDAEGSIYCKSSPKISLSQKNPFVLDQIKYFLEEKLKICCKLYKKKDKTHELTIHAKDAAKFANFINSSISYKRDRLIETQIRRYFSKYDLKDILEVIEVYLRFGKVASIKFAESKNISKNSAINWIYNKRIPRLRSKKLSPLDIRRLNEITSHPKFNHLINLDIK